MKDKARELDELLHQWAESRGASEERLTQLQEQIIARAGEPSATPPRRVSENVGRSNRRWPVVVVAALCVVVSLISLFRQPASDESRAEPLPRFAGLNADELQNKALLLEETSTLFDHQLSWLTETGDELDMGLSDRPLSEDSRPIAVRVIVQRRRPSDPAWSLFCQVDVLAYSEEVVKIRPRCDAPGELTIWSFVLPDGLVAVDTELSLAETAVLLSTSQLYQDSTPRKLLAVTGEQYEFRVFQSAAVL